MNTLVFFLLGVIALLLSLIFPWNSGGLRDYIFLILIPTFATKLDFLMCVYEQRLNFCSYFILCISLMLNLWLRTSCQAKCKLYKFFFIIVTLLTTVGFLLLQFERNSVTRFPSHPFLSLPILDESVVHRHCWRTVLGDIYNWVFFLCLRVRVDCTTFISTSISPEWVLPGSSMTLYFPFGKVIVSLAALPPAVLSFRLHCMALAPMVNATTRIGIVRGILVPPTRPSAMPQYARHVPGPGGGEACIQCA